MSEYASSADLRTAPTQDASINRLSIAHLFLWITMTSVALAFEQRRPQTIPFSADIATQEFFTEWRAKQSITRTLRLIVAPANGAALAGAAIALWRLGRRRPGFPTQPGHWLLIVIATQYTLLVFVRWLFPRELFFDEREVLVERAGFLILATIAAAAAITSIQRRWRLSFALLSAGYGGCALLSPASAPLVVIFAANIGGLSSLIGDLRIQEHRDIFHWIGSAVLLVIVAAASAFWCFWQFN